MHQTIEQNTKQEPNGKSVKWKEVLNDGDDDLLMETYNIQWIILLLHVYESWREENG